MAFRVDTFPGDGVHKTVYFQKEEAARVDANAARIVYPDSAVFVLREMPGVHSSSGAPIFEIIDQVM